MQIVLRKVAADPGHVEIVEVDGGTDKIPAATGYDSEAAAVRALAQYLGLVSSEFDDIVYRG